MVVGQGPSRPWRTTEARAGSLFGQWFSRGLVRFGDKETTEDAASRDAGGKRKARRVVTVVPSPSRAGEDQITKTVEAVEDSGPALAGGLCSNGNKTGSLVGCQEESSTLGNKTNGVSQSGGAIVRPPVRSVGEDGASSRR